MAAVRAKRRVRNHPRVVTAVLTVVGYVLVLGTLYVGLPIYPDISLQTVNVLSHAIAVINTTAVALLASGWWYIRRGDIDRHRTAMIAAFALILVFLVLYLLKTGGGGRKDFVGPQLAYYAYGAMLAIHIVLSIVSVPVVLYALVLGLTHTPAELRGTAHARIGRIAAAAWILSLSLGVIAYVLLNHVYTWEFVEVALVPIV